MAFMHLGGDAGAKPTYFEVYAADKLVPTLKAAVIYSLSVSACTALLIALRQPRCSYSAVASLMLHIIAGARANPQLDPTAIEL